MQVGELGPPGNLSESVSPFSTTNLAPRVRGLHVWGIDDNEDRTGHLPLFGLALLWPLGQHRRGGGGCNRDHKQQVDERSCPLLLTCCSLALSPLLAPLSPPPHFYLRSFPEPFSRALCPSLKASLFPLLPCSLGSPPLFRDRDKCWFLLSGLPSSPDGHPIRCRSRVSAPPPAWRTPDLAPQHAQSELRTRHPAAPESHGPGVEGCRGAELALRPRRDGWHPRGRGRVLPGLCAQGLAPSPVLAPPLRAWPRPSLLHAPPLRAGTGTCGARRASCLGSVTRPAAGAPAPGSLCSPVARDRMGVALPTPPLPPRSP